MGGACLCALAVAMVQSGGRGARTSLLAAACTLPIFFGYWLLLREEQRLHDNASYDAYKLFTVFYPGILVSLCLWLRAAGRAGVAARVGLTVLWAVVLFVNLSDDTRFNAFVRQRSMRVDPALVGVSRLETMPGVGSVNVLLANYWERLWANSLLLRKPQYFTQPNYEGRPVTSPLARWDLIERQQFVSVHEIGAEDPLKANLRFRLVDRTDGRFLTIQLSTGWYPEEQIGSVTQHWGGDRPQIVASNPHEGPVNTVLMFTVRSVHGRALRLWAGPSCCWEGTASQEFEVVHDVPVTVPPGPTVLRFETPGPADHVPGDSRALTFALAGMEFDVPPLPTATR